MIILFLGALLSMIPDRELNLTDGLLPAGFLLSAIVAHGLLVLFGSRADPALLPIWVVLSGTGLAFQYRLQMVDVNSWQSPGCWSFAAGPVVLALNAIITGKGRMKILSRLSWVWILAAFGISLAVLATGVQYRGGIFGPGKTTPTELIKLLLILGISGLLVRYGRNITRGAPLFSSESRRAHIIIVGAWLLPAIVLALLGDLGMLAGTGLLLGVLMTMATFRIIYPVAGLISITACGWLLQNFLGKGKIRFGAWINPFENPDTSGFQTIRSLFAVFNGEFFGQGIGNGFPRTVPLVETDFVYAALAEEFGWLGTVLLLILVLTVIRKSMKFASETPDPFSALVSIGCGAMWLIQILLHVGGVTKLIPMTGVPFPGLSAGGTATLVFAVMIGWMMGVSDGDAKKPAKSRTPR